MADDIPLVFVSASQLGYCLRITDVQVAMYGRRGVFPRKPHPRKARAFEYELIGSVTRYVSILDERLRTEQQNRRRGSNAP